MNRISNFDFEQIKGQIVCEKANPAAKWGGVAAGVTWLTIITAGLTKTINRLGMGTFPILAGLGLGLGLHAMFHVICATKLKSVDKDTVQKPSQIAYLILLVSCLGSITIPYITYLGVAPIKGMELASRICNSSRSSFNYFTTLHLVASGVALLFYGISLWWATAGIVKRDLQAYDAVLKGDLNTLNAIIASNPELATKQFGQQKVTLLHVALYLNRKEIAQALLEKADPKIIILQDNDGNTPLHVVTNYRRIEMLQPLREKNEAFFKKALRLQNLKGSTPLHLAIPRGQESKTFNAIPMIEVLLECADIESLKLRSEDTIYGEETCLDLVIRNIRITDPQLEKIAKMMIESAKKKLAGSNDQNLVRQDLLRKDSLVVTAITNACPRTFELIYPEFSSDDTRDIKQKIRDHVTYLESQPRTEIVNFSLAIFSRMKIFFNELAFQQFLPFLIEELRAQDAHIKSISPPASSEAVDPQPSPPPVTPPSSIANLVKNDTYDPNLLGVIYQYLST